VSALIRNEYAKMRHLHVAPVFLLMLVGVSAMTIFYALGSGIGRHLASPDAMGWKMLFGGLGMATSLAAPILLAVVASRQVEVEHVGNGWLAANTAGLAPGRLCRAKFISLGLPIAAVTVISGVLVMGFGTTLGISTPLPTARWTAYIAALVVINLAVLAFHIVLSAKVANQLMCVGVGLIGLFLAIFGELFPSWFAHLIPWGYYALTKQADFVGEEMVYFDLPGLSVAALALVGGASFMLVTARFDRQEA